MESLVTSPYRLVLGETLEVVAQKFDKSDSTAYDLVMPKLSPSKYPWPAAMRKLREQRHLTQERLGEMAGLHQSAIAHLEAGRREPTLGTLVTVADALFVPLDMLVGRNFAELRKRRFGKCADGDCPRCGLQACYMTERK